MDLMSGLLHGYIPSKREEKLRVRACSVDVIVKLQSCQEVSYVGLRLNSAKDSNPVIPPALET